MGAAGVAGLATVDAAASQAPLALPPTGSPAARSVILLWMDGGPSQVDTFDPKPEAPSGWRGEFGAIPTSVPRLRVGELLPRMARVMDRCTLIRTLSHDEGSHERACHALLTGRPLHPSFVFPSIGAIAAHHLGATESVPSYVALPNSWFGFGFGKAGELGAAYDPISPGTHYAGSAQGASITESRNSATTRRAVSLELESGATRDWYGNHPFGRGCLRARRLVEAGARFVTVTHGGWDTHCDNGPALKRFLVPPLDQALSALILDLEERGLLSQTLVLCMGEFGRSPQINALGGRDHWPRAGWALMAGAGVAGGQVIGRTDLRGAEPVERLVSPREIAATVLAKLGIDPNGSDRSHELGGLSGFGKVISEV